MASPLAPTRIWIGWLATLAVVTVSGCARSLVTIDEARTAFTFGNLDEARESLTKLTEKRDRYRDVSALDLAVVELAAGDPRSAERRLVQLRDHFDGLPTVSPIKEAASMVTDDTVRRFRPAGYEQVMIRTLLSICSLASDQVDAESYALQASTKQLELAKEAEQRGLLEAADVYRPIAIAPYVRGMLREATHHDYDDAEREYRLVSAFRPTFAPAEVDIARASGGVHSRPGHGVLYVIACVGRGPELRETVAPTTSTALSIASSILNAQTNREDRSDGDVPALPNIASVKVPEVVVQEPDVATIGVRIGGTLYGATQTLTDVGQLAAEQLEAEMPWTIARAVVRRATKEAAVAKAGDSLGLSGTAGSLFHFAAASAWSGAEHADTRCWGLLPREIQVFRTELPKGRHEISLQALGYGGTLLLGGRVRTVNIVDGTNTYVIVICPNHALYEVSSG